MALIDSGQLLWLVLLYYWVFFPQCLLHWLKQCVLMFYVIMRSSWFYPDDFISKNDSGMVIKGINILTSDNMNCLNNQIINFYMNLIMKRGESAMYCNAFNSVSFMKFNHFGCPVVKK
ncbi:Sentrin-specific protease 1 [Frankliniella fusca]|uniref:Sentrin-specific protease 1 n=1 Tax=Frankliniella fusca TaxID=407009 RepID=A0AAE1LK24_9NEOP|nr:Sentrin-specific protease 1 [Frankliniella fusca]